MAAPRVLITRPPHQASTLADQLRAAGLEAISIPAIEIAEPATFAPLDAALSCLDTFDWLIFTSTNAVEAFHRRLTGSANALPAKVRVAAIGSATARALDAVNLRVDLLPAQAVAESLVKELLPYALQSDGRATRFLLLRAEIAREVLPDGLRAAGADVTIVPVYRNVVPSGSIVAIQELFSKREWWPDAITFTSSSTATNLVALLEAAERTLSPEIQRVSIGPITSQTLRDLGLPPHAEASEHNLPGLVAAVVETLRLN